MNLKQNLIIILVVLVVSGCGLTYRVLLGVDSTPNWNTKKVMVRRAKKLNIPEEFNLVLDTAIYYQGIKEIYAKLQDSLKSSPKDSLDYFLSREAFKDDTQPVHFRLFDKGGKEVFKIVNCYIDPVIPMNWNVKGCFNQFPPKIDIINLNAHYFDLNFLLGVSSKLTGDKITFSDLPKADYYAVILWNDILKRPSKKLIQLIQEYTSKQSESIQLIYINNQNSYLWEVMEDKYKEEVIKKYEEGME